MTTSQSDVTYSTLWGPSELVESDSAIEGHPRHQNSPGHNSGLICTYHQLDRIFGCGACGYPLNLCSSNRITSNIGSEYRKAIKKGIIPFLTIDLSRFTQVDEFSCTLYACGFYQMRTKLLCRKCGMFMGYGYAERTSPCGFDSSDSSSSSGTPGRRKYNIKIRALQPSDGTDVPNGA